MFFLLSVLIIFGFTARVLLSFDAVAVLFCPALSISSVFERMALVRMLSESSVIIEDAATILARCLSFSPRGRITLARGLLLTLNFGFGWGILKVNVLFPLVRLICEKKVGRIRRET